jgi:hypothetical protein
MYYYKNLHGSTIVTRGQKARAYDDQTTKNLQNLHGSTIVTRGQKARAHDDQTTKKKPNT